MNEKSAPVTCIVCGREFEIMCNREDWAYRIGAVEKKPKYFCRYNCLRAYERQVEEEKERKRAEKQKIANAKRREKERRRREKERRKRDGSEEIPATSV